MAASRAKATSATDSLVQVLLKSGIYRCTQRNTYLDFLYLGCVDLFNDQLSNAVAFLDCVSLVDVFGRRTSPNLGNPCQSN